MADGATREVFAVVALPAPLAGGESFSRRAWPAHVTLASNFVIDGSRETVVSIVHDVCAGELPLEVRFADEAMFGPRQDVPVQLVDSRRILALHERLADALEPLDGFAADEPAFWRDGYRPHMTHVPGISTPRGTGARLGIVAIAVMTGSTATVFSTIVRGPDAGGSGR